ncbi:Adaptive-response sensory-kinase SasA [Carnimonas sp. R-84981]|uniref:ATP-binding protein n=1 Tax=Carnimonas bestiolae TaxID=3402172 RepID=UPI003EDC1DE6
MSARPRSVNQLLTIFVWQMVVVAICALLLWGYQAIRDLRYREQLAALPTAVISYLLEDQEPSDRAGWLNANEEKLGVGLSLFNAPASNLNFRERTLLRWTGVSASFNGSNWSFYRRINNGTAVLVISSVSASNDFPSHILQMLRSWVEGVPPAAREARLTRLIAASGLPMTIGSGRPTALSDLQIERLNLGDPVALIDAHAHASFYILLDDHRWIKIGPASFANGVSFGIAILVLVLGGIGATLVTLALFWRDNRSMRRLAANAELFFQGSSHSFSPDDVSLRFRPVARRMNVMASQVQAALHSQQELIQAVSHEFRTPLSRIRFALQMIGDVSGSDAIQRQLLEVDGDIESLDKLIDDILTYARVDSATRGGLGSFSESVDLRSVVEGIVQQLERVTNGITFTISGGDKCRVQGDVHMLKRALQNVIENAVQHTVDSVNITLCKRHHVSIVVVEDNGEGVPQDERKRILKPFTRVDASRARPSDGRFAGGGFGMGLAIVERIVLWHGGRVSVSTSPALGGARFILLLADDDSEEAGKR